MLKILGLLLFVAWSAGCKAHMLETRGDGISLFKLPNQKPGKGGVIRWLANGPSAFKKARRADAEKQMAKFCGGKYQITAEGPRSKFGAAMPIPKGGLELDEYWYAAFDCR